ncbi:MAG TPA: epimerase [Acidobacteriota bacterium]
MKVVLFGATGMVGQGVLRECLIDPEVESVLSVVRRSSGQTHQKLKEIIHDNFFDFSKIENDLRGYDACFFCLGITSVGMSEEEYQRITYDITMAAAQTLLKLNPNLTFVFVSGTGTDSTGTSKTMWARIKGKTENALLQMPFKAKYMFRPAFIQPLHGITSKTKLYRVFYVLMAPVYPLLRLLLPRHVTTTENVGRAMLKVAKHGASKNILENADIDEIARSTLEK